MRLWGCFSRERSFRQGGFMQSGFMQMDFADSCSRKFCCVFQPRPRRQVLDTGLGSFHRLATSTYSEGCEFRSRSSRSSPLLTLAAANR